MNRYGRTVLLCLVLGWAGGRIAIRPQAAQPPTQPGQTAQPGVRAAQLLVKLKSVCDMMMVLKPALWLIKLLASTPATPRAVDLARALAPKDRRCAHGHGGPLS